jgi:hypothetical protein
MIVQTINDTTIDHIGILVGKPNSRFAPVESSVPNPMPRTPPVTDIIIDSIRN